MNHESSSALPTAIRVRGARVHAQIPLTFQSIRLRDTTALLQNCRTQQQVKNSTLK